MKKERELEEGPIYPILLDNFMQSNKANWISELSSKRYPSDFSQWQITNEYKKEVSELKDGAFKHLSNKYILRA